MHRPMAALIGLYLQRMFVRSWVAISETIGLLWMNLFQVPIKTVQNYLILLNFRIRRIRISPFGRRNPSQQFETSTADALDINLASPFAPWRLSHNNFTKD